MIRKALCRTLGLGLLALAAMPMILPAQAALPPQYQRERELTAVMQVAIEIFDFTPIDAIEWVEHGRYKVRAGTCTLEIVLDFIATPQIAGPAKFEVVPPGEPEC